MRVSYSEGYHVPLPHGRAFPMDKFPALRAILLVHTDEYLRKLRTGEFERAEIRRLGLPWSPELVRRSRLAVRISTGAGGWHDRRAVPSGVAVGA